MKNWKIKLVAGALALACIGSSACTVVYETDDTSDLSGITTSPDENTTPSADPVVLPTDEELAKVIATVGDTEITAAEYYFFIYELAQLTAAQNGNAITMYGGVMPDFKNTLKQQSIMPDKTWHDYLKDEMKSYLEYTYLIAEAAKKEGITLDDEELAEIQTSADEFEAPEGIPYLTKELAKKCYEIGALADKYRRHINDTNPEATDAEITAELEKNRKNYVTVSLNYFAITYDDGTSTAEETTAEKLPTKDDAQRYADKFLACTTNDQFKQVAEEYIKEFEPDSTEEDIEYYVGGSIYEGLGYQEGFEILDWAFDNERKDGDKTAIWSEKDKAVHIGILVKAPVLIEDPLATVRHILVEKEDKAKEIVDEFNASDKTSETFGNLATKYTTDPGSKETGGLYENFGKGEMVAEFENWAFDEARVAGDVGIVKTSYGYHVMYFVKKAPKYLSTAKQAIETERLNAVYDQINKDYKLELNEDFTKDLKI